MNPILSNLISLKRRIINLATLQTVESEGEVIVLRWDRFAFLLALYGAGAFALYTLTPTLLDPLLHTTLYGTRTYPLGPWVALLSLLVFVLLYASNIMKKNILRVDNGKALNRGIFSFLSILIPTMIVLPNFLPGIPHGWVFDHSIMYGAEFWFRLGFLWCA